MRDIRRPIPLLTRRTSLALGLGGLVLPAALRTAGVALAAPGQGEEPETHGLSVFGDLQLPPDFKHLPYVDPQAPKGGEIRLQISSKTGNQNFLTFDTLNVYNLPGDGAAGLALAFDTLMTGSADEPDALYGLVARAVRVSPDKLTYRFLLRKEAKFADGTPLTAKDVKFSFDILRDKGHPTIWSQIRRDLESVEVEGDDVVTLRLKQSHARDFIFYMAALPIFSSAYYAKVPFDQVTLEPPLGSGPYKVGRFSQGKYIAMERRPDYWAKDLPINVGTSNFGTIRYEYYADRAQAFEAFKTGAFTYHEEFTSRLWATGYDIPPVRDGRMVKTSIPDSYPQGVQGWFINTRRAQFKNPLVRQALGYAFDFKATNAKYMYSTYERTVSFFQNSPMQATGAPDAAELALLEPFRAKLPKEVFGPVYLPPESDGSGSDRVLLRKGFDLLMAAGCKQKGQSLALPDGKVLAIEFLIDDPVFEPHHLAYIRNLKLLGIDATLRRVDGAQYQQRTTTFDFDIIVDGSNQGLTPGAGMRDDFGSESVDVQGMRNFAGIADPVVDALIDKAVVAPNRETLTTVCRCIDRILRAGHYWVPMWNKARHDIAYWDLFDQPKTRAKYGVNAISTWWFDSTKAKKTALPG